MRKLVDIDLRVRSIEEMLQNLTITVNAMQQPMQQQVTEEIDIKKDLPLQEKEDLRLFEANIKENDAYRSSLVVFCYFILYSISKYLIVNIN